MQRWGEVRSLEQFFFGQTNDAHYLRSLQAEPGVIWRRIGRRVALTRVTRGPADSNGRSTLRFTTLLEGNDRTALSRGLNGVIAAGWQLSSEGAIVTASSTSEPLPLNADGISQIALAVRNGKRIVRSAERFSLRDVAALIESCADEQGFSLCFKSLNERAPTVVNLVSKDVSERMMSLPRPAKPTSAPRGGRSGSNQSPPSRSNLLVLAAVFVVLLIQVAVLWNSRGNAGSADASSTMQDNIICQLKNTFGQLEKKTDATHELLQVEKAKWETRISGLESRLDTAREERQKLGERLSAANDTLDELLAQFGGLAATQDVTQSGTEKIREKITVLAREIQDALSEIDARLTNLAGETDDGADSRAEEGSDDR